MDRRARRRIGGVETLPRSTSLGKMEPCKLQGASQHKQIATVFCFNPAIMRNQPKLAALRNETQNINSCNGIRSLKFAQEQKDHTQGTE